MEPAEQLPNLRRVVDREDERTGDPGERVAHDLELLSIEHSLAIVILTAEVRRVEIEQRLRAIIAADDLGPVQVLEHDGFEPRMRGIEGRLKRGEPEPAAVPGDTEHAGDLAAEGQALEIDEARRALEVGERCGVRLAQALELLAGGDLEAEHVEELGIMALEDPEEVHDLAVEIVHDLELRTPGPAEEHAAHAGEGLDIDRVIDAVDPLDDLLVEGLLAAHPEGNRSGGGNFRHCHGRFVQI